MIPPQPIPEKKPPGNDSLLISYMTLRKSVGWLGIVLPVVLVAGSLVLDHSNQILVSLSAYYYTCTRNALIGILCAVSLFLFCYRGYDKQDSIISNLAGLFALGVAFFPTSDTDEKSDLISTLHYVFAGIFFTLLSYMSIFLFTKTSGFVTTQKKERNQVYVVCGIVMISCSAAIPLDGIPVVHDCIGRFKPTLIFETGALWAFGVSWLTKGEFILKDK